MEAIIINTGNELLTGETINTNASWLASKLYHIGVKTKRVIVIGDDCEELKKAIDWSISEKPDILIITGGLGPTHDDKTIECLSKTLKIPTGINTEAYKMIAERYKDLNLPLSPERTKMAKIPVNARPIENPVGVAPGIELKIGKTVIYVLPGVPREMREMMERYIIPKLKLKTKDITSIMKTITIEGVPESSIAPILKRIQDAYPGLEVKSHPIGSEWKPKLKIVFRLIGKRSSSPESTVDDAIKKLLELLDKTPSL